MAIPYPTLPERRRVQLLEFPRLDGGLNLQELDYRLSPNQSPEMKNLWWQDGLLQCRDGQSLVWSAAGTGYACCAEPFWDHGFFHIGDGLYCSDLTEAAPVKLCDGVPENRGTFLRYGEWLFYKNRGGFFRIAYVPGETVPFTVTDMRQDAYVPVTVINADPATGAGDTYQPENRLSPGKTVWYNAAEGVKVYRLPVQNVDGVTAVTVDGVTLTAGTDYTVDAAGTVTFAAAPPVTDPPTNNTVAITYEKANAAALSAVMACPYAAVYGGDNGVCMVLGGCPAQPNAFFWNGNDHLSMNPGYWPMPFYNLAGDTADAVTGFGRQYGMLVVFKERSVGRAEWSVETVDGRDSISLTYAAVNSRIGCDLPWTIQLVENNLVFANSRQGVFFLRDSSAAYENNIVCISRKVNGTPQRPGLLADVAGAGADGVCAFDDESRYWLCAGGHVYAWDYTVSDRQDPSWFFFTDVPGIAYLRSGGSSYHLDKTGRLTRFVRDFLDYGGAIEKVYQFPPLSFGGYDRLKDVLYCIFTVRSDTDSIVDIRYDSDYETRRDRTDIQSLSYHLAPRNLSFRCLTGQKYAHVARRRPGCRHVRHFAMRLSNCRPAQDLSIVSAQTAFRYLGKER